VVAQFRSAYCVGRFAMLLRNGYFTKKLLVEAVHALFREDLGGA